MASGDDRAAFLRPGGNHLSKNTFVFFRQEFERLCRQEVTIPGLVMMRDVAISRSEFVADQKAVSKIQDFQEDAELFRYCSLPQVGDLRGRPCSRFHGGLSSKFKVNARKTNAFARF